MADLKKDHIDFHKLEKELENAIQADAKYWRENDAKLRAVEQRVETYDQFRDMVAAAHLRPLDKKDRISESKLQQPWNPLVQEKRGPGEGPEDSKPLSAGELPANSLEFSRDWRRCGDRYALLKSIGGERLRRILQSEIGMSMLGEILRTLRQSFVPEDTSFVMEILEGLPECGRFNLALDFLGPQDREALQNLLEKLDNSEDMEDRVNKLKEDYHVT